MKITISIIALFLAFNVNAEYLYKLNTYNANTTTFLVNGQPFETTETTFIEITAGNAGSIMNLGYYDNMTCNYSDVGGNQTQFNILAGLDSTTLLINGSVVNQLKNHVDENGNRYFYEDVNEDDINQPVENKYYIGQSTDDFMFYNVCT